MDKTIYYSILLLSVIVLANYINYLLKKQSLQSNLISYLNSQRASKQESRLPSEWSTRTKSFDSERAMPRDLKFMAEPDKCFSCTNQVARQLGTEYAIYEQPTKLFSMGSL
jgi:hypothetical protein